MTDPVDRVEVQVPAEQVRVGDLLADHGDGEVRQVIPDAAPDYVYAFAPEQVPLVRSVLVRVRRARDLVGPPDTPPAVDPVEYAAVRDLALAIADLQPAPGKSAPTTAVHAAADRVRKAQQ